MRVSPRDDTSSPRSDDWVRLRVKVYDALAAQHGYRTITAQAQWHGIGRQHLSNIKAGKVSPSLATAMRVAADCGVPVEVIWERVSASVSDRPGGHARRGWRRALEHRRRTTRPQPAAVTSLAAARAQGRARLAAERARRRSA